MNKQTKTKTKKQKNIHAFNKSSIFKVKLYNSSFWYFDMIVFMLQMHYGGHTHIAKSSRRIRFYESVDVPLAVLSFA